MAPVSYLKYDLKLVEKTDEERQRSKEQLENLINRRANATMEFLETNKIPKEMHD